MNLQTKLQELKSMHDQGLVTAEVYAEQQRLLLSEGLKPNEAIGSKVSQEASSVTKVSASAWKSLGLVVVLIFGGIWFASKFGSQDTKDTVNQIASQTGISAQIIPWADRAETVARKLIELNEVMIAQAIQGIAHPSGKNPVLTKQLITKLDDRILLEITVAWKGGIVGTAYETAMTWEIARANHISAKIVADSAPTQISQTNKEILDNYFKTKVYPAFYKSVSGTNP
jgi:hypothetical protein